MRPKNWKMWCFSSRHKNLSECREILTLFIRNISKSAQKRQKLIFSDQSDENHEFWKSCSNFIIICKHFEHRILWPFGSRQKIKPKNNKKAPPQYNLVFSMFFCGFLLFFRQNLHFSGKVPFVVQKWSKDCIIFRRISSFPKKYDFGTIWIGRAF